MRADMVCKPVSHDVREAYAPMTIERQAAGYELIKPADRGTFYVMNRSLLHTTKDYAFTMIIQDENGCEIASQPIDVPFAVSGEEKVMKLKDTLDAYIPQGIKYVEFAVVHTASGNEVSRRQYLYCDSVHTVSLPSCGDVPVLSENDDAFLLSGSNWHAAIRKSDAALIEYSKDGITKAWNGHICLDRPYCGLDAREGWNIMRNYMDEARALDLDFSAADVFCGKSSVIVKSAFVSPVLAGELTWTIYGDGTLLCSLDGRAAEGLQLPRFGMEFTLPGDMQSVKYTGYGPHETYADRMIAARFGQYSASVDDLSFDIAPPSENGGHEGTIALCLSGKGGDIRFDAFHPFHFDARNCTVEDLKAAMHTHEVPHRDNVTLHLDAWHMPIGGDMSWSTVIDINEAPHAAAHSLRVVIR
ncbi:MAG: hypothetical protein IKM02_03265, partial [Clostridia bacterium]|nr:hypothetical protein [Clostridia bacterium]